MIQDPSNLISHFIVDAKRYLSITVDAMQISHDLWEAPHTPKDMPSGTGAVYVFSLSARVNASAPSGRVLKVGRAGPNSKPRFKYQHYNSESVRSTLAGAIKNNPLLWRYIGYNNTTDNVGEWIKQHTDRNNFYFKELDLVGLFEVYAKAHFGPVFEGSLSSKV